MSSWATVCILAAGIVGAALLGVVIRMQWRVATKENRPSACGPDVFTEFAGRLERVEARLVYAEGSVGQCETARHYLLGVAKTLLDDKWRQRVNAKVGDLDADVDELKSLVAETNERVSIETAQRVLLQERMEPELVDRLSEGRTELDLASRLWDAGAARRRVGPDTLEKSTTRS